MNEVSKSLDTPASFGLFIAAISDEDRSKKVICNLYDKGIKIDRLIVINYYYDDDKLKQSLSRQFPLYAESITCINVNIYEPLDCIEKLREKLEQLPTPETDFGMDITCTPIPHFFIILKYLSQKVSNACLYYTEPRNYVMTDDINKSYSSTLGSINTDEIYGFSGISAKGSSSDRVLLCFLGFDNDLLPTVIQDSSPSKIITINGFPSFFPKFKDISLINNEKILSSSDYANLRDSCSRNKNLVYIEASNPFDVINTLEEIKSIYYSSCIDIVPLSSKPMALGVCLFALFNEDIRVIYPFPETYVRNTTNRCNNCWEYRVDFKKLSHSEVLQ
jgi:hypothetical protein